MFLPWVFFALVTVWDVQGDPDTRIVGGETAPDGSRPYQVSLRLIEPGLQKLEHFCGGSILNIRWVLSAAYCTSGFPADQLLVIAGSNKLSDTGDSHKIDRILNNDFNPRTGENDISLIRIQDKFKFSNKVAAIKLPTSDVEPGTTCVLSGWGFKDQSSVESPNDLQMVTLKTLSTKDCKQKFSDIVKNSPIVISDNKICAFSKEGQGACHGDSGGPLTANNAVIGVASRNACGKGYPDLFTKVYKYIDWIKENLEY